MARLANPLVYDLLAIADALAAQTGRMSLRKAGMRRTVSSAHYAVFHLLCFVCASELVGWSRTEVLDPVYRLLDHGNAKRRLSGRDAAALAPTIFEIGTKFADLQEARHVADYSPPALPVRHDETLSLIAVAKQTVSLIESLEPEDRLKLAVVLIAKPRQA